jgi:hypothetical protein
MSNMLVTMQYIWTVYPLQGRNKLGAIFWWALLASPKTPRSLSQTEQAVEWEQISSNGQVLPMPALIVLTFKQQSPGIYFINIESI